MATRPIDDVLKDKAAAEAAVADFLEAHPNPLEDSVAKVNLDGLLLRRELATNEWRDHPARDATAPVEAKTWSRKK